VDLGERFSTSRSVSEERMRGEGGGEILYCPIVTPLHDLLEVILVGGATSVRAVLMVIAVFGRIR